MAIYRTPQASPSASGRLTYLLRVLLVAYVFGCGISVMGPVSAQEEFPPSPSPSPVPNSSAAIHRPLMTNETRLYDRPLVSLHASIKEPDGDLPANFAAVAMNELGVLFDSIDDTRPWLIMKPYEWDAPATRNQPLLFEEPNLERLGYTNRCYIDSIGYETDPVVAEVLQPVVSGAHFFGRALTLPYFLGALDSCDPIYTLGVDRPGSPVCYRRHRIPLSLKGAVCQAGVVCTLVFAIP